MSYFTQGMNGKKVKLVDNQDGTHSISARPDRVPTQVRVPKKTEVVNTGLSGYALFVDKDDNVYYQRSGILFRTPDGVQEERLLSIYDFEGEADQINWICKTHENGKYVMTAGKYSRQKGQVWTADSLEGPWTKKLDVTEIEGLGDSEFRMSNCWHHYDGTTDIIIIATYGVYHQANNPNPCNHVYLSLDEGQTFKKILETDIKVTDVNNHIHAVSYSPWDGWIWVVHGDGDNRGIMYSYDLGENWVIVSDGKFRAGGWQPTSVIPLINQTAFGTDNPLSNGVMTWHRPGTTKSSTVGYAWQKLHYDGKVLIARKGAQISAVEAYIPLVENNTTTILVTGDGGFSWHAARTFAKGLPFELGFTNPDSNGYVWGSGMRKFKVTEWDNITQWIGGKHLDYTP